MIHISSHELFTDDEQARMAANDETFKKQVVAFGFGSLVTHEMLPPEDMERIARAQTSFQQEMDALGHAPYDLYTLRDHDVNM